jgi:nitroimidazol reductase NimA-like FMN-containing flavoprotein (pyridoxamine 5'-phosphate oxidase superfamily)
MIWLIKSPLHFFVSKNMMLITCTGHKSGKNYTVPVNYLLEGNTLYITSFKERTRWRNLRAGNLITLRLRGKDVRALPQVSENAGETATLLNVTFK